LAVYIIVSMTQVTQTYKRDRNNEKGEMLRTKMEKNKHKNRVSIQLQLTNIS